MIRDHNTRGENATYAAATAGDDTPSFSEAKKCRCVKFMRAN